VSIGLEERTLYVGSGKEGIMLVIIVTWQNFTFEVKPYYSISEENHYC
jgi:hypothetical protein